MTKYLNLFNLIYMALKYNLPYHECFNNFKKVFN